MIAIHRMLDIYFKLYHCNAYDMDILHTFYESVLYDHLPSHMIVMAISMHAFQSFGGSYISILVGIPAVF